MSSIISLGNLPNGGGSIQVVTPAPSGAGGLALNNNYTSLYDYLTTNTFLPLSGGSMTGNLNLNSQRLDFGTGGYLQDAGGGAVNLNGTTGGDSASGQLNINGGYGAINFPGGGYLSSGSGLQVDGGDVIFEPLATFNQGASVENAALTVDASSSLLFGSSGGATLAADGAGGVVQSGNLGFYGTTPGVAQQTVSGSISDLSSAGALKSLLTALAALGLIVDSTTP